MQIKHTLHAPLPVPHQFKIVVYHKIANFQWKCNLERQKLQVKKKCVQIFGRVTKYQILPSKRKCYFSLWFMFICLLLLGFWGFCFVFHATNFALSKWFKIYHNNYCDLTAVQIIPRWNSVKIPNRTSKTNGKQNWTMYRPTQIHSHQNLVTIC